MPVAPLNIKPVPIWPGMLVRVSVPWSVAVWPLPLASGMDALAGGLVERPVGHQAVSPRLSHAQQREARESQNDSGKTSHGASTFHQNEEHFSAERYNEFGHDSQILRKHQRKLVAAGVRRRQPQFLQSRR